ncbi:unnamed protein product, partial [Rotaria sp. Silwood1]
MRNSYFKTDRIFFLLCIGIIILFFISLTSNINHGSYSRIFTTIINKYSNSIQ